MEKLKEYTPLINKSNAPMPVEDPEVGPWRCTCLCEDDMQSDILEVHRSHTKRCVTFRIGKFVCGDIQLGECMIMDRKKATCVRDRLNALLEALPED
jgi:hypothetical protein